MGGFDRGSIARNALTHKLFVGECTGMIGSERPPEALAQYTGFLMNWVAQRSRTRFAEALEEELGLHPRDFGVLAVVEREPGITQQAIGEAAGVDPSTMVATLDGLEERGLAERRHHSSDRRKRAVYLTEQGRAATEQGQRIGKEVGKETLAALTADERKQLNTLLRKIAGLDTAESAEGREPPRSS